MQIRRLFAFALAVSFLPLQPASAAVCVNRFLAHSEGARQVMTLLTGKLTYQEAQDLAKQQRAVEWLDDSGKVVATSVEIKPIRPMPVGCDGKTSGVVIQATFFTVRKVSKKIMFKLGSADAVEFEEQGGSM
jgi:hypothetical protein